MTDKVSELEARIAELEAAVEWFGDETVAETYDGRVEQFQELRDRAFPPKFEEVEEHGFSCSICHITYGDKRRSETCCDSGESYPAQVKITIPIVDKVKRRAEIEFKDEEATWHFVGEDEFDNYLPDLKFYAEWTQK